jgi:hypothetical protein
MQAIHTKYYGPTNFRGSRIKASCDAATIWVPYSHQFSLEGEHRAAAMALLEQLGWSGKWATGALPDGSYATVCIEGWE